MCKQNKTKTETRKLHETSNRHKRQGGQGQKSGPRSHLFETKLQTQVVHQERCITVGPLDLSSTLLLRPYCVLIGNI